jgi:hypothetical protein
MAPTPTSSKLIEIEQGRRKYVSNICARFIADYLMQLDNLNLNKRELWLENPPW